MKKVRKAVFPVAGLGTRFLPATKAVPKEMLTIVDRPLIQYAVEEALEAGADQERLLEALLTLASSERGLELREPVSLDRLADRELQRPRADVERLGLQLQLVNERGRNKVRSRPSVEERGDFLPLSKRGDDDRTRGAPNEVLERDGAAL